MTTPGAQDEASTGGTAGEYAGADHGFAAPDTVLTDATPESLGLDPAPIAEAVGQLHAHEEPPPGERPLFSGAVGIMGHQGRIVERDASGWALRYADAADELPRDQWVPVRSDTIFDLASVSKLFTAIAVVQLVEEGVLSLDDPAATHLPEFGSADKESVTVRQLLTHRSGLTSWLPLWSQYRDAASRIRAVLAQPLSKAPGAAYLYSDLNLITLGVLVEHLRGAPLDAVVHDLIAAPLGLADTGYNPAAVDRTAATEYQTAPPRGMVRGEVHDENAWSLGGVAGHAGVFSTADDLAVLAQTLLNGGAYRGARILDPGSVADLVTSVDGDTPRHEHGLGFELNQRWYMDDLSGPRTAGHTGYTGTSVVIDFDSRSFAILLTNRVHPSRDWGSVNVARREWAHGLAGALGAATDAGATEAAVARAASVGAAASTATSAASSTNEVTVDAPTEERNPETTSIDTQSSLEILRALNEQDATVPAAVSEVLPQLAALVDRTVESLRTGGAIHYFGAGTSGRLAVLDAVELLPTFHLPPGLVVAHLAGGADAMLRAVENVEDDVELGRSEASSLRQGDIAIGLTASGRTPFVAGALARAREVGAVTALITANPQAELAAYADHLLAARTGPEALTGSTRLKAGTAQKLILGSFSTAVMIRLGRTWSNLMVDVVATNAKLRGRVVRILQEATGADASHARRALDDAGGELKPALLSMLAGVDVGAARRALEDHEGSVATALAALSGTDGLVDGARG